MRARVHTCCAHLSIFGDGQHTRSSGLKVFAVLEAKRGEPKGLVSVLPLPGDRVRSVQAVLPGRGEAGFGGCLLLVVMEVFGPPKSGGLLVVVPGTVLPFSSLPFSGRASPNSRQTGEADPTGS